MMRLSSAVRGLMSVVLLLAIMLNGLLGMRLCHDGKSCAGEVKVSAPHCPCEHGEETSHPLLSLSNSVDCGRSCACVPVQQNWRGSLVTRSVEQSRDKAMYKVSYSMDTQVCTVPKRESVTMGRGPIDCYRLNPSLTALRTVVLLT